MYVKEDERPSLEDDEFYVKDMVDMDVVMVGVSREGGRASGREGRERGTGQLLVCSRCIHYATPSLSLFFLPPSLLPSLPPSLPPCLAQAEDISIGRVTDVITAENARQGLANDLLEIELANEDEQEGAEGEQRFKRTEPVRPYSLPPPLPPSRFSSPSSALPWPITSPPFFPPSTPPPSLPPSLPP